MRNNLIEQNKNTLPKDDLIVDSTLSIFKGSEKKATLQGYSLSFDQFGQLVQ